MKMGLENKRSVYALAGLGVILAGALYSSFFSSPSVSSGPAAPRATASAPAADSGASGEDASGPPRSPNARGRTDEFLPVLHAKRGEKPPDPPTMDPTLRLDLLAKLQDVPAAGSGRDLFSFGKPPAPVKLAGTEPTIAVKPWTVVGPPHPRPPAPKVTPVEPPPPPIPLKYYGICTVRSDGFKTAFFMDGDDILIQAEGSTFKGRYRLLRIGADSAVVEDLQYKHEQTLPLAEDAQAGGTGE